MELGFAIRQLRRRLLVISLALVALGSPWVQRGLVVPNRPQSDLAAWLWRQLSGSAWWPLHESPELPLTFSQLLATVTQLAAMWFLVPRYVPLQQGRLALLVSSVGAVVVASALAALPGWAMLWPDYWHYGFRSADQAFQFLLLEGLSFGLLLGLITALALLPLAAPPEGTAPSGRKPARKRERSTVMAEYQRPNSTPLGSVPGDVTRYLSAAVYTDPRLADQVVEQVVYDEFGAVASSPGFDLVPVARHSIAAQGLRRRRDLALAGVFGVILLVAPAWLLFARAALWLLSRTSDGSRADWTAQGRSLSASPGAFVRLLSAGASVLSAGVALAVFLGSVDPGGLFGWLLGSYLNGIPALVVTIAALLTGYLLTLRHTLDVDARLRGQFRREVFRPDLPVSPSGTRETQLRLAAIAKAQRGNLTIYSGYNPFVGFSDHHGSWSNAFPLLPPPPSAGRPAGEVRDFDVWDMVGAVRHRLRETSARHTVSSPAKDESDLSVLVLQDRIFANGAALAGNADLLPEDQLSPAVSLPEDKVREIALNPTGVVRHYLAAHLPLWGDDVVPSLFLHMSTDGRTMHIQAEQRILGPVHARYHDIDLLPGMLTPGRRGILRLASVSGTARALFSAPRAAFRAATAARRRQRRRLRELLTIEHSPGFDYGASFSVRELADSQSYQNYFQGVDAKRAFSTLDRHAIAAIVEFLDDHGVDTTDLRRQQQTILNHGVIQQGGISMVGNQAVGEHATVTAATENFTKDPERKDS